MKTGVRQTPEIGTQALLQTYASFFLVSTIPGNRYRQVDFEYGTATINGSEVVPDFDGSVGDGGAVVVADTGKVIFQDFAYFYGNKVKNGGSGGTVENLGEAYFSRASYFMVNFAVGECREYRYCSRVAWKYIDCCCDFATIFL